MPPSLRLRAGGSWAALLLLLLCLTRTAAAARLKRVTSPLSDCGGGVTVLRAAAWPGGVQVTFALADSADVRALPAVSINGVPAAVAPAPQQAGLTAVLVVPAAGQLDAQCIAVQALVESLPVQERLGVWLVAASGNVSLVADFTNSKRHVIARLAELRLLLAKNATAASDEAATAAMEFVLAALERTDSTAEGPVSRNLVAAAGSVFRAAPAPTGSVDATPVAVSPVLWLVPARGSTAADVRNGSVGWSGKPRDRDGAISAGRALADAMAARRAATFRAAACLAPTGQQERLRVEVQSPNAGGACSVSRADVAAVAHEAAPCDAEDAAADAYPYADTVTLSFTPEEDAVFAKNRAFYKGSYDDLLLSKTRMNMSIAFGAGTPIRASAHFRVRVLVWLSRLFSCANRQNARQGVSSFRDCALRKSLALKLSGSRSRRLQPGSATDHIFLISLCADDRYVKTQASNSMARTAGVYRVPQRYVRMQLSRANGTVESLGVYLLMEDPDVTFAKGASALASIVRRRSDPERATAPDKGTPSVKLPNDAAAAADALARYDVIGQTAANCTDQACYPALAPLFDVDMYIRWLAFANVIGLGDYVDEVFFYTSDELSGAWYWSINAWDTDDSFEFDAANANGQGCHHSGLDAQFDPHGLLFCSEATFDKVLVRSPDMYGRYADHLEFLLRQGLSAPLVTDLMRRQLADIFGLVSDSQTASGLLELIADNPDAADVNVARTDIADAITYYSGWLEERRAYLLHQLRIYRTRTGRSAAAVPVVDGVGDFVPGAILTRPPLAAAKTAVRPRATRAAAPNAPLHTACAALTSGELNVTLEVRCLGYTNACQEVVLAPRIRVTGSSAVSLAGLRLGVAFDRVVTDPSLPDPTPFAEPPSDWELMCYSGGGVAERAGVPPPDDACAQLGVRTAVLDDRIELQITSGTLCAGCVLDLGVDDALASVWHARWLPLSKPSGYVPLPPAATCASEARPARALAVPPAVLPQAAQVAVTALQAPAVPMTPVTVPGVFTPPPPQNALLSWLLGQPSPPAQSSQQVAPPPESAPRQCAAWQLLFGCTQRPAAG